MKIYEPAVQIIEHAFIAYESDPNKFIQNDRDIEENNDIIPREIETNQNIYEILNPQENNNFYDIGCDLQIRNYNYINSVETKKKIVNNTKYMPCACTATSVPMVTSTRLPCLINPLCQGFPLRSIRGLRQCPGVTFGSDSQNAYC